MENEKKFVDGLFINKPSEKAPDFVRVKASISADKFIPFLKENVNGKGYLNFDILESKEGKLYAKIDTFEPTPNATMGNDEESAREKINKIKEQDGEIRIEDIPF